MSQRRGAIWPPSFLCLLRKTYVSRTVKSEEVLFLMNIPPKAKICITLANDKLKEVSVDAPLYFAEAMTEMAVRMAQKLTSHSNNFAVKDNTCRNREQMH